jgi:hypothetical protein
LLIRRHEHGRGRLTEDRDRGDQDDQLVLSVAVGGPVLHDANAAGPGGTGVLPVAGCLDQPLPRGAAGLWAQQDGSVGAVRQDLQGREPQVRLYPPQQCRVDQRQAHLYE